MINILGPWVCVGLNNGIRIFNRVSVTCTLNSADVIEIMLKVCIEFIK